MKRSSKKKTPTARLAATFSRILGNPVQTITVPLSGQIALGTNGSGVLSAIATCDPSGGSGSSWTSDEYTHYQNRYALVRCIGVRVTFTSILPFSGYDSKTTDIAPAEVSCTLLSQTAPSAYASVIDNFGTKTWNMSADTSKGGLVIYMPHDLKTLGWLPTTSPSAVTGPYAGCPGGVGIYMSAGPVSASRIGTITIVGLYQFRSKS